MYMKILEYSEYIDPSESQLFPKVFDLQRAMADSSGGPIRALMLELFPSSLSQHLAKCRKGLPFGQESFDALSRQLKQALANNARRNLTTAPRNLTTTFALAGNWPELAGLWPKLLGRGGCEANAKRM